MKRVVCFAACTLMLLAGTTSLYGQAFQGGLRGAVRDAGGGVVPGVEISLVNEGTNIARTTLTNELGEYNFSFVAPGTYKLRASLTGFKTFERSGINIGTQQFVTIDVALEVGSISDQITVMADSPLIESTTASTGGLLTTPMLNELPNTGRNPFMMALTVPNVIHTGNPFYVRMQDQTNSSLLSLGGGPIRGNNYTIDGVPVTDLRNRAIFVPNIDAIKEIKVQVNTYDAEMGRTGGGVFNTTMKSGGNSFHGSAHIQQRPSAWAANDFFLNRARTPKQDFFYWLWGGSGGGPIVKDKTFFWVSHEGYHTGTIWAETHTVPTDLQKQGDFSQTRDTAGNPVTIYDPLTTKPDPANPGRFIRDPFPGNRIPASRINPVGAALVKFWPGPKSPGDVAGRNNFTGFDTLLDNTWQTTAKVDHTFSNKHSVSGNYSHYRSREPFAVFWRGTAGEVADGNNSLLFRDVHMPIVNYTMTPNATSVINIRYGYYWWRDSCVPASKDFDLAKLGFDSAFTGAAPAKSFPSISVEGFRALGAQGDTDIFWTSHTLVGSYAKFIGRHSIKFGGDWRKIGVDFTDRIGSSGSFSFSRSFSQRDPFRAESTAGNGIASLLLGFADSGSIVSAAPLEFFTTYFAGYVHDDIRLTRNLTLNLGLRYEFETELKENNNQLVVGFDRTSKNPLADRITDASVKDRIIGGMIYAGVGGNNEHQGDPQKARLQPRIGFAYSMGPKTVVRGGYGIFYAPLPLFYPSSTSFGALGFVAGTDYVPSVDGGLTPANLRGVANPFPLGIRKPTGNTLGLLTNVGGTVDFVDQDTKYGRVQQYSLDIQHEVPGNLVLTLGIIGSSSKNISLNGTSSGGRVDYNQLPLQFLSLGSALLDRLPNPFFGVAGAGELGLSSTITRAQLLRPYPQFQRVRAVRKSDGYGRYNAFIIKAERRLDNLGIGLRASYTWSKMLDNYFGEVNNFIGRTSSVPLNNYDLRREYSYSIYDIPHRWVFAPIWDLPLGRGKRWASSGAAEKILGGWNITPVIQVQSGFPTGISQSSNNVAGGFSYGGQQRPNRVSGASPCTSGKPQERLNNWFNPSAFRAADPFTLGDAPRRFGDCRGPGNVNMDVSIRKTVHVSEGMRVSFRLEALNATNTPRFSGPNQTFGSSSFGIVGSTQGFARIIQYMLRFDF